MKPSSQGWCDGVIGVGGVGHARHEQQKGALPAPIQIVQADAVRICIPVLGNRQADSYLLNSGV